MKGRQPMVNVIAAARTTHRATKEMRKILLGFVMEVLLSC